MKYNQKQTCANIADLSSATRDTLANEQQAGFDWQVKSRVQPDSMAPLSYDTTVINAPLLERNTCDKLKWKLFLQARRVIVIWQLSVSIVFTIMNTV